MLLLRDGIFDKNSLDIIGYLNELEELTLDKSSFMNKNNANSFSPDPVLNQLGISLEGDNNFSLLKELKKLTYSLSELPMLLINIISNHFNNVKILMNQMMMLNHLNPSEYVELTDYIEPSVYV